MNFFFLLPPPLIGLKSEIDIVNSSPSSVFSKSKSEKMILHYFYSDGSQWIFEDICSIGRDESITINENDIKINLKNKSVFLSLNKQKKINTSILLDEDYHESKIAWRANIKIKSEFSSTSYQGEYPGGMINKKISLVSCSPMVQNDIDTKNFFYLVNLNYKPQINNFVVKVLDANKKIQDSFTCYTNTINLIDLDKFKINDGSNMKIFSSDAGGGVPIYFSIDKNNRMSIEHTHPPTEYVLHGNRFFFQKIKKKFWSK